MKKSTIILALALGVSGATLMAQTDNDPSRPRERREAGVRERNNPGRRGDREGLALLPSRAIGDLNLSSQQRKRLAELRADTQEKLEKILTPEQLRKLRERRLLLRERNPRAGVPYMRTPGWARPGMGGPGMRGSGMDAPPPMRAPGRMPPQWSSPPRGPRVNGPERPRPDGPPFGPGGFRGFHPEPPDDDGGRPQRPVPDEER